MRREGIPGMKGLKRFLFRHPRARNVLKSAKATVAGTFLGMARSGSLESALTVFVYHDVSPSPSEFSRRYHLNVPPEVFDFQIGFIKAHFTLIGPDDLLAARIPPKAALITFDDGLKGIFTHAVPLLEKHDVPVVIFLNMAPVKGDVFWSGLITYLCEKQEGFIEYLREKGGEGYTGRAPFLACSREIVFSYLKRTGHSFEREVSAFTGDFATEEDLRAVSGKRNVFFGNHLYNHDNALFLSDGELIGSFQENEAALKRYPNHTPLFSFPFGQPGSCFSPHQADLLLKNGARKVFSSYPLPNRKVSSSCLHRIGLTAFNDSPSKVWYQIFYEEMRS